jgi:Tfp pilus assembly protein PilO
MMKAYYGAIIVRRQYLRSGLDFDNVTFAMRLLIEIIIIVALIYLGWEKSFKERLHQVRGSPAVKQTVSAAAKTLAETPTPTPKPTP